MFAYGLVSVVLVLYLVELGLKEWEVGLLLALTLAGDTVISLWLTTTADQVGRRRTLIFVLAPPGRSDDECVLRPRLPPACGSSRRTQCRNGLPLRRRPSPSRWPGAV